MICVGEIFVAAIFALPAAAKIRKPRRARELSAARPAAGGQLHARSSGGRLVMSTFADPKTYNPITANEESSRDITVSFCVPAQFRPEYAGRRAGLGRLVDERADNKTWTFHLRKNLRWSDGQQLPLTTCCSR